MSMSTHIIGFKPPDKKWQAMKDVWDACETAGIAIHPAVIDFFEGETPDPSGVEVELLMRTWQDDSRQGFEIDITDIPDNVWTIRFYNSW